MIPLKYCWGEISNCFYAYTQKKEIKTLYYLLKLKKDYIDLKFQKSNEIAPLGSIY